MLVDPYALCQLLACYGINSNKEVPPQTAEIKKLFNKMKDPVILSLNLRHIVSCKLLIDLDNHDSLRGQLNEERKSLEDLKDKINELKPYKIVPQFEFQLEWCYLQKNICEKLLVTLVNKMRTLHMEIAPLEKSANNPMTPS